LILCFVQFVVVGVHSAKFDNEKDSEAIRNAVLRYGISHPVKLEFQIQLIYQSIYFSFFSENLNTGQMVMARCSVMKTQCFGLIVYSADILFVSILGFWYLVLLIF